MEKSEVLTDTSIEFTVEDVVDGASRATNELSNEGRLSELNPVLVEGHRSLVGCEGETPSEWPEHEDGTGRLEGTKYQTCEQLFR